MRKYIIPEDFKMDKYIYDENNGLGISCKPTEPAGEKRTNITNIFYEILLTNRNDKSIMQYDNDSCQ